MHRLASNGFTESQSSIWNQCNIKWQSNWTSLTIEKRKGSRSKLLCSIQLTSHGVNTKIAPSLVKWVKEMRLSLHIGPPSCYYKLHPIQERAFTNSFLLCCSWNGRKAEFCSYRLWFIHFVNSLGGWKDEILSRFPMSLDLSKWLSYMDKESALPNNNFVKNLFPASHYKEWKMSTIGIEKSFKKMILSWVPISSGFSLFVNWVIWSVFVSNTSVDSSSWNIAQYYKIKEAEKWKRIQNLEAKKISSFVIKKP